MRLYRRLQGSPHRDGRAAGRPSAPDKQDEWELQPPTLLALHREELVEALEEVLVEPQFSGSDVLLDVLGPCSAEDPGGHSLAVDDPGKGELG